MTCVCYQLPSYSLIRVQGKDARTFLQGQLTNDINQVTPTQAQISAWCSPKGRMLAIFLIFELGDALYLKLPSKRMQAILKRLRMFVLRSDVRLSDASDELGALGIQAGCGFELPEADFACSIDSGLTLIRIPGGSPRALAVGDKDQVKALADTAQSVLPSSAWALADIRAGLPQVYDATAEAFVPQMLNLDLIGGVSFTKGCYTGQEVVARTKYLGQVKRRMFLAHIECAAQPLIGAKLYSPSSQSAQGAGQVVDVQPSESSGYDALVMAEISSVEAGDLRLENADGAVLQVQVLISTQ